MVEEKAQIHITTPGRFTYEFGKDKEHDVGTFELPDSDPGQELRMPQDVMVKRRQPHVNGLDQLLCQKLVIRMRRRPPQDDKKPAQPEPAGSSPEQNLEIEMAHATGTEVTLISDAENLEAHCVELIHDLSKGQGLTILRGNPMMRACKDGNVIHAQEVQIRQLELPPDKNNPEGKKFQQVSARGPGQIDMLDKVKNKKTMHATWSDMLTTTPDGGYTLLTLTGNKLTGDARLVDDEHDQFLQAETLKVWLEEKSPGRARTPPSANEGVAKEPSPLPSAAGPQPAPTQGSQPTQQNLKPHHLEALTDVLARSAELNLHDTARLVVWFKDLPDEGLLLAPSDDGKPSGEPGRPLAPQSSRPAGRPEGASGHSEHSEPLQPRSQARPRKRVRLSRRARRPHGPSHRPGREP